MKIFKLTHVLGAALIGLASFSSCSDACKDVDCGTGTCLEGVCTCPDGFSGTACATDHCGDLACDATGGTKAATAAGCDCNCNAGYTGADCATEERAQFVSTYLLNEDCGSINGFATSIATSASGITKIAITGFGAWECNGGPIVVLAAVNGLDLTVDSNQSFCSGGLTINSGSGSINAAGTVVTINYSYTSGGATASCTSTYTKS